MNETKAELAVSSDEDAMVDVVTAAWVEDGLPDADEMGPVALIAVNALSGPMRVAELLALADRAAALTGNGSPAYRDGYDRAIGDLRELIADRCDELGVKVEDL